MSMTLEEFESTFDKSKKNYMAFMVLKDQQWHCRECEYTHTGITQIAGGSGIQGLERGTRSRPGMIIESDNHLCVICEKTTRHDRWQGAFKTAVQSGSMPKSFVNQVMRIFGSRDIIENTERPHNQLTIDHKLPRLRWNTESNRKLIDYSNMDEEFIREHFQLLKKSNGSVSHNLLKSRTCEDCFRTGRRGKPFGIDFFYAGGPRWAPANKKDASGCVGCGWYDFAQWREKLNEAIKK